MDEQKTIKLNNNNEAKKQNTAIAAMVLVGTIVLVVGLVFFILVSKGGISMWGGSPTIYVLVGIAIMIIITAIAGAIAIAKKQEKHEPDYYAFFVIGITWLPLGIALKNYAFFTMGLVFMAIGMVNKDKWKNKRKWNELSKQEQNLKVFLIVILGIMVLAGLVAYYFAIK